MEASPPPSTRGRSLSHLFSKSVGTHRSKHSSTTASSINMSDAGDHYGPERRGNGFRSHFDSALEKLKIHESSGDVGDIDLGSADYGDELDEGGKGLSKMISRKFKSRKKKKEMEDGERGRSVLRKGTLLDNDMSAIYDERNLTPSFGQGDGSSILTYESEVE